MKVYTKTGDKGKTSLFGGKRVAKNDAQINAYGTLDELNSWMGLLRDFAPDSSTKKILVEIQETLFTIGSYVSTDAEKKEAMKLPTMKPEMIVRLEKEMDAMDATLPEMRSFILPGGHQAVSYCHIARTVCRRAERAIVGMNSVDDDVNFAMRYVNRLSDYLFVLARKWAVVFEAEEIPWKPQA